MFIEQSDQVSFDKIKEIYIRNNYDVNASYEDISAYIMISGKDEIEFYQK